MDSRKFLVVLCSVLAVILVILCVSVVTQQSPPKSRAGASAQVDPRKVIAPAADSLSASGMMDRIFGGYPGQAGQAGSSPVQPGGQEAAAGAKEAAEAAAAEAAAQAEALRQAAEAAEAAQAAARASQAQDEREKERLRLVHIKDREQGERRMYGAGSRTSALAPSASGTRASSARGAQVESEDQLLSKFQAFVDKLHHRASASKAGEGDAQEPPREDGAGGRVQITTVEGFKGEKPPTLQLLEKVNQDAADSLMMTSHPELEDGSKDRHGKKFDGNLTTYSTIPIDETNGAFGGREIRASHAESVNTSGAPADLKH